MRRRTLAEVISSDKVVHLTAEATVLEACRLMAREHVGAVLVMSDGRLEGIVSERDVATRVVAAGREPRATTLAEAMTRGPVTATRRTLAVEALRTMHEGGFRHLPVVEADEVVAMVSLRDFMAGELAEVQDELAFESRIIEG